MSLTRKAVNFTRKDVMRGEEFVGITAQKQIDGMLRTVTSTIKVGGEYQIAEVTNPTIDYMVTRNTEKFRGRIALYVKNPPPRTNNVEILSYTDYDPFGSPMGDRRFVPAKPYRFGYQGQFAEDETDENGYNSFEARMYDSKIGRWTTIDPAKQFFSPYLGMGNNPVYYGDPNGENVIVMIDRDQIVLGIGHVAMLIEDGSGGWLYYSKDVGDNPFHGEPSSTDGYYFKSLEEFVTKNSKGKLGYVFDDAVLIESTPPEDALMRAFAYKEVNTTYDLFTDNCDDAVFRTLKIISETGELYYNFWFPNRSFDYLYTPMGKEYNLEPALPLDETPVSNVTPLPSK